jgi:hypothetical protein
MKKGNVIWLILALLALLFAATPQGEKLSRDVSRAAVEAAVKRFP